MTPEEAQEIVTAIWNSLSVGEQERLLIFFRSPKLEPFREGNTIKHKALGGPSPDSQQRIRTHAVGR